MANNLDIDKLKLRTDIIDTIEYLDSIFKKAVDI
jgi:hypothetical protein